MKHRFVALVAAALLAACASTSPEPSMASQSSTPPDHRYMTAETPFPVGSIPSAVLHDAQRNKDLSMAIEYPTRGGPYPVIVFSHGFGSSSEGYVALTEYWTGHGYVVIKPSHADANALRRILADRREARRAHLEEMRAAGKSRKDIQKEEATRPEDNLGEGLWDKETPAAWENRAKDIELIIDNLATLQEKYPELKGKFDTAKIGVAGHSYGAFTTMQVTGVKSSKLSATFNDARIKAAIAMSPQGIGDQYGLTPESWTNVKTPFLYMTGSLDFGVVNHEDPKWRHDPFQYSPAGDKYFISFEGARHSTFTGGLGIFGDDLEMSPTTYTEMPTTDAYGRPAYIEQRTPGREKGENAYFRDRNIFSAVKSASLTFWDAYLKGEKSAKEKVAGKDFEQLNGGRVTVEKK
jgi:predicted dienelactone hydrolase